MKLDMSTFQPVGSTPVAAPPQGGKLDMSTFTPVDTETPQPFGAQGSPEDQEFRAQMIKNEPGDSHYTMQQPTGGTLEVPHSYVVDAATRGYDFANDDERTRYRNNARQGGWDLQDIPVVGGFMQNVSERLAANLQNMSEVVAGEHPLRTLKEGTDVGETMFANPNAQWANTVGDVLSFIAMDPNIQSMASPVARLKATTATLETIEKSPQLQKLVMAGMENPRIARATTAAMTGAPSMAIQDLLTGRGARRAAISGATGLVAPYPIEAGAAGVSATTRALGRGAENILERFKPPTVAIGSEAAVPVEAGQVTKEGELTTAGTQQRKTAVAQQQAFDRDMQVGSKRAVRASLQQVNDAIEPPPRPMLPAPSGEAMPTYTLTGPQGGTAQPFEFNLGGPPVEERAEGVLTQPAEKMPPPQGPSPATAGGPWTFSRQPETVGGQTMEVGRERAGATGYALHPVPEVPEAPTTVEDILEGRTGQPRPPAAAPGREDIIGGGGAVRTTTNPAEAVGARNEYRRLMNSPEFSQFTPEQQTAIRNAHDYLTDQIGAFYAQPHGGIIPADISAATEHVISPGDAADQIRNAVKPGFAELNRLTDGRVNQLSDEIQDARKTMWDPKASPADKAEAQALIQKNNDEISKQIMRHAGDTPITRQYYNAMKTSYAHASFLDNLNDVIEGWANGISRENTANNPNLVRVIRANTEDFEKFLSQGNNRQMLSTLLGSDAETSIKSWGELLSNPATARRTGSVLENTMNWAMHNKMKLFAAWSAPILGTSFGKAYAVGMAGYGVTIGARKLMRMAAVSPKVTSLIDYAVRNDVNPSIYSPLIARTVSSLWGQPGTAGTTGANEGGK